MGLGVQFLREPGKSELVVNHMLSLYKLCSCFVFCVPFSGFLYFFLQVMKT